MDSDFVTQIIRYLANYFSRIEVLDMIALGSASEFIDSSEIEIQSSDLERLVLPCLKKLILPYATEHDNAVRALVGYIMKAAPNLKRIEEFFPGLTKTSISWETEFGSNDETRNLRRNRVIP